MWGSFMANEIKHLDDDNFNSEISKGVYLVDFHADWCGPCRMMAPVVEEVANQLSGKIKVGKLDIDASQKTTATFNVTSIPTLILFKDGKEVKRVVGLKDADTLKKMISAET